MSKFVNFKKREIALPPGCKDLIDVLKPGRRTSGKDYVNIAGERPTEMQGGEGVGGLSEIEKYVAMVFESRALAFTLEIIPPDKRLNIGLCMMEYGTRTMMASLSVQKNTELHRAVRGCFIRHGLHTPEDSGMPEQFYAELPWQLIYEISPFPSDAAQLARILIDLYREVGGLTDESELSFHYAEMNYADSKK